MPQYNTHNSGYSWRCLICDSTFHQYDASLTFIRNDHILATIYFFFALLSALCSFLDKFLPPVMKIYVCWMGKREPAWAWENNKRKKSSILTCYMPHMNRRHEWQHQQPATQWSVEWSISNEKAYQKLNYKCLRKFFPVLQLVESVCAVLCHHWSFRAKLNCFVEQEFVSFSSTPSSLSFTLVSLLHDSRFIYSTLISRFNFIT